VVVAATVVGFGTSLPEMVVSVQATVSGYPNLILGNVVGSNIANVLLVGGASAAVFPLGHKDAAIRRNVLLMLAATVAFSVLALLGHITRVGGLLLVVGFAVMMMATAASTLQHHDRADTSTPLDWVLGLPSRFALIAVFIVVGITMLPLGAQRLVVSAVVIAQRFEVSEAVIGLTVLAIGTSLPELVTTVLAALERRSDVAIGAIIGSNTFNILAIMGLTASLSPEPIFVSGRFLAMDLPVMLVTSGLLAVFAWKGRAIGRAVGIGMLVSYVVYLGVLLLVV
jgi:cation:H+ antiporter